MCTLEHYKNNIESIPVCLNPLAFSAPLQVALAVSLNLRTYLRLKATNTGNVRINLPNIDTFLCWDLAELKQFIPRFCGNRWCIIGEQKHIQYKQPWKKWNFDYWSNLTHSQTGKFHWYFNTICDSMYFAWCSSYVYNNIFFLYKHKSKCVVYSFFSWMVASSRMLTGMGEETKRLDPELVRHLQDFVGVTNGTLDTSTMATLSFLYIYISLFGSGWDHSSVLLITYSFHYHGQFKIWPLKSRHKIVLTLVPWKNRDWPPSQSHSASFIRPAVSV